MNGSDTRSSDAIRLPLGQISLPERTIEHDLAIQGRYQEFSAELLRISLIGMGAIGFALSKTVFLDKAAHRPELSDTLLIIVAVALFSFGISAASALIHRFSSVDSVSWHIQSLRRGLRNEAGDAKTAAQDGQTRYRQFRRSRTALRISATALGVASCALAAALILVMFELPESTVETPASVVGLTRP